MPAFMPRSLQTGGDDGRLGLLRRNVRKYGAIFNPAARSTPLEGKIMLTEVCSQESRL
jgi:hypothetical protein